MLPLNIISPTCHLHLHSSALLASITVPINSKHNTHLRSFVTLMPTPKAASSWLFKEKKQTASSKYSSFFEITNGSTESCAERRSLIHVVFNGDKSHRYRWPHLSRTMLTLAAAKPETLKEQCLNSHNNI